ncbi:uncharacterized protein LOC123906808 isoform X9 [Trifolium pratense]|uniref:uncharacterized protein LOC123906808 isoform X9 n=1 Tax=Trifolium pratense TaxID=57577 RepID=UPI001E69304D|nr:uncharacterized protein LOC123906808 isoform X9 [Trifolium pratense]XP_045812774.1 uncharacterized protein LOC123906808 isoform X9 [Trifolium pratense]
MATRGRRTKRARGRGSSNPPKPSTSLGVKIDKNRIQKKGPVKGFDALNNKQKSAPFNFEQNEDNNYNDSEDEEMQLLEQAADETDRRKVISLEGISSSSGRRITRSHGKGCSDPPGASPLCIDPPPQPGHTRVSPGVKSDKNRIQKKRREKYIGSNFGLSNNARSSSVGYHVEGISNPGRGVRRGRGRGRCIAPGPSQSYIDPPTPAHTLVSPVVKNDNNRVGRKGLVKHGRGRGRSDPPEPLSCIVPPPPAAHTSVSPVRAKQKRLKNTLKSAQQTQCATNPQAPAQVHTSPQAPHVPSEIHTSPQTPTSAHSLPQTHHVGHSPTQAPTYSSPLVEGSSYATLNDTTPVNSSSTYEIPQQSHTSRQCVGRESADCWTVEAIDPQGAIKRIKLKYWQVNDLPIGEHVIVHFNDQGAAYGEAQGLLAGYCGTLATNPNLFPINYERWLGKLGMPKSYLDNCFEKNIEPRFQFRTTEALAKRYCKLSIAKKWAAHRQNLWTRFYDPSKTRDQITSNIPLGVDPIQWAHFVDYRLKPETLERCRKNKENRSKQLIPHTGGSKPLSRKRHEMFLQTGEQPCRGKLFIETHKKKDGSFVNDAAKDIVEQIEVGLTQSSVHESEISPNDVLGKVLGPEHPGRVRCMGMGAAPTNTFKNNGVRLSILGNSSTAAATSSSNFWQEKYTHLESQVQNTMEAFKAYIIMKEGRIPDQVASIFGSSNWALTWGPNPEFGECITERKEKELQMQMMCG